MIKADIYLDIIVHGQVTNRLSIFPSFIAEFLQSHVEMIMVAIKYVAENGTILESGIHSLTVEGNHSMSSVTQ